MKACAKALKERSLDEFKATLKEYNERESCAGFHDERFPDWTRRLGMN